MSAPRRSRQEIKQETREALIKAAAELFRQQGLDVSLDAICAHAGYTRGAFYVHFANRDELLSAVMGRIGQQVLDALFRKDEQALDLLALLQRFLAGIESGEYPLTRKGGMPPHQLLDACARSEAIRQQYVGLVLDAIQRVAVALREGQALGQVRSELEVEPLATLILALAIGLHTMYDLQIPMNMAGSLQAALQLVLPPQK